MGRSSLITLPPELLFEICEHLCRHCQHRHGNDTWPWNIDVDDATFRSPSADLLSLSRVCKTLRAVTQPFLYHILATFHEHGVYYFIRDVWRHADQARLHERVSEIEVGDAKSPNRPEDSEGYGTLISMLLDFAPNLQRAHFRLPSHGTSQLDLSRAPLTSLKALVFSGCGPSFPLEQAIPFIKTAPNLEILHYTGCTGGLHWFFNSQNRIVLAPFPPLENLTELTLTNARLDVASFFRLLSTVGPRLSKVSIQQLETKLDSRDQFVDFSEVISALSPWTHTLKELSYTVRDWMRHDRVYEHPSFLQLREFTALETLGVQLFEVVLVQPNVADVEVHHGPEEDARVLILPESLRELTLFGMGSSSLSV
ncbi:hypothetical protein NEMBOFW57_002027 [Staphylotrichum longicolle]|uniref:F-box domain-containing protein n=1 Tax=Staphylotrichum longicolle TaxID=669026 RepID=A0AAD4F5G9_9PEZI|nr:hypothetical protein NEMBOFW57_002027 [Staphylotrichum longicolle]